MTTTGARILSLPDGTIGRMAAMSILNRSRLATFNRQRTILIAVLVVWAILAGRLVHIQYLQRARFRAQADEQQTRIEPIPARPGDLLDRDGRLLATSVRVQSLSINPQRIDDSRQVVQQLEQALDIDPTDLLARITRDPGREFLWVKRRLSDAEEAAVRTLDLPRGSWRFHPEFLRRYPQGSLASHVIGLRDIDGVGRGGAEEAFDALLRGEDGQRRLVRDARGYVIEVLEEVMRAPQHGESVVLTIDSVVQLVAERELDAVMAEWSPQGVCAIVLDPRSGELLAMASRPTFDPNDPSGTEPDAWSNRALTALVEPGSTIKPCIVAWAIDKQIIALDERIDCGMGAYRMGGRILHDHQPHGMLSVGDILVRSSNIGMAKIGERLSNRRLRESVTAFGFGRRTGIELPGELAGAVRPLEDWTSYSTGSIPMGQELSCTPLQVLTAYAVLANGGRMIVPRILSTTRGNSTRMSHAAGEAVLSEATADWIVRGPLREVVERGTGTRARVEGLEVFGKTGTAQKFDPATGRYSVDHHVCSFVCGAPAADPELLVLVSVDGPSAPGHHTGGSVAAPAAAAILRQALSHDNAPAETATASAGRSTHVEPE